LLCRVGAVVAFTCLPARGGTSTGTSPLSRYIIKKNSQLKKKVFGARFGAGRRRRHLTAF